MFNRDFCLIKERTFIFMVNEEYLFAVSEDPELEAGDKVTLVCDGECIVSLVLVLSDFTVIYVDQI